MRHRQGRSLPRANTHPFLFTLITLTAAAELGLTTFLISAGNEIGTWASPRYHSLYVVCESINLWSAHYDLDRLILLCFEAAWTLLFAMAYMIWVVDGSTHLLAHIASSVVWLLLTSILWVSSPFRSVIALNLHKHTTGQGTGAGIMHNTRTGGNCPGHPPISRFVIILVMWHNLTNAHKT